MRTISEIATEIVRDWREPYFGARPYLGAMLHLGDMTDTYGADPAPMVVAYFLGNAKTWKGETARRVKAELNQMLKGR
jgi:hypothetical protein